MKGFSCPHPMLADSVKAGIHALMRERLAKKENNATTMVTLQKSVGHFMCHTPHHPRNAQALRLRPQVARADANDAVPKQLGSSVRDKI